MREVIVNNVTLNPIIWNGETVITCADIDRVHERPTGTARRNFLKNKKHMIENKDFYKLSTDEIRPLNPNRNFNYPKGALVFSKSGYLMIVKSLNDDRAWEVQRQLVNAYFTLERIATESENCKSDNTMVTTPMNSDLENTMTNFLKQQLEFMKHEKESNELFKETMLKSLATLSEMVIKHYYILEQLASKQGIVTPQIQEVSKTECQTSKTEENSKDSLKTKNNFAQDNAYKMYKKHIEELCWQIVLAHHETYENIPAVKEAAYNILKKKYGICLTQDRKDFGKEMGKQASSTIEVLYWKEKNNHSYTNLLQSVLDTMLRSVCQKDGADALVFPCKTIEDIEKVVRHVCRKYKTGGINGIHFYKRFFSYLNNKVDINWEYYEKQYRYNNNNIALSDRVSKINMLKTMPDLVDQCLPYFNEYIKDNYPV